MSTASKLDPLGKQRRAKRAAFLRNLRLTVPKEKAKLAFSLITALRKIHKDPRLTGAQKHELFRRGVRQLVMEKLLK